MKLRATLAVAALVTLSSAGAFAAGDPELGRYFLDAIHPFVWRRSLDFGAIGVERLTRARVWSSPDAVSRRAAPVS
mgnify:CR=1 FL=1